LTFSKNIQTFDLGNTIFQEKVVDIAENISIELLPHPDKTIIKVDGKDRSTDIRKPEVSKIVSPISSNPKVRARMVHLQQELGKKGGVVMDGRDIGTVVFPHAELKLFMIADPTERAKRRLKELQAAGNHNESLENVLSDIQSRDKQDENREVGPLKQAPDSLLIDTTHQTIEQVITDVERLVHQRVVELNATWKGKKSAPSGDPYWIAMLVGASAVLAIALFVGFKL